jgi:hypothetical protein
MGAARSMSRNIEAVSPEPAVENTARFSSMKRLLGGKPCWVAIVQHSSRRRMARSAAPAATISPTAARIKQVIPALVAMFGLASTQKYTNALGYDDLVISKMWQ